MCRWLSILSALIFISAFPSFAQIAEGDVDKLDTMLDSYMSAIEPEDIDVKCREADFIIESCTDSVLRDHVGIRLFNHYKDSPLMGDESVAVHIYDRWIDTGEVRFTDESAGTQAMMFARFNKSSLLGCKAPELLLRGLNDEEVQVPCHGDRTLLFFYNADCSTCRIESILLRSCLTDMNVPLTLISVYVGEDRKAWEEFAFNSFKVNSPEGKVVHAWDPEAISEYQFLYNVTGTPRMFLIDKDGYIIGRRLDSEALVQLLSAEKVRDELDARAPVGSMVADLKLPGVRLLRGREKVGRWRIRGFNRVVFYVENCDNCKNELSELRSSNASGSEKVLLVNLDELVSDDEGLATRVFDLFDLTVLPYSIILDRGKIISKQR